MKSFLLLLSMLLSFSSFSQELKLYLGNGLAGFPQSNAKAGAHLEIAGELSGKLFGKTGWYTSLGLRHTDHTDRSEFLTPIPNTGFFVLFPNDHSSTFRLRQQEGFLAAGLLTTIGKWSVSGGLNVVHRLASRITYTNALSSSLSFPEGDQIFELRPGEEFQISDVRNVYAYDFTKKTHVQGELGLAYALLNRLSLQLVYRSTLGDYRIERYTLRHGIDLPNLPTPVDRRLRGDAAVNSLVVRLGWKF